MKKIGLIVISVSLVFLPCWSLAADTIKVGVPLSQTGTYAASGEDFFKGIKMAIDEVNQSGGLLGKQLEVIRFDSKEYSAEVVMQGAEYLARKNVASVHAGWAGWGQDVRAYGKFDMPFFAEDASQSAVDVFNEDREKYYNIYQLSDVLGLDPQFSALWRVEPRPTRPKSLPAPLRHTPVACRVTSSRIAA